jgi:hypothetical protein
MDMIMILTIIHLPTTHHGIIGSTLIRGGIKTFDYWFSQT